MPETLYFCKRVNEIAHEGITILLRAHFIMKKYYYVNKKGQQAGPVTADQLLQHGVTTNTFVWCAGMDNWEKAGSVEELKYLFTDNGNKTQTGYGTLFDTNPQDADEFSGCPANNLTWAIVSAASFWPLAIVAITKAKQVKKLWKEGEKELAEKNAEQARSWAIASILSGAVLGIISNLIMLLICITIAFLK